MFLVLFIIIYLFTVSLHNDKMSAQCEYSHHDYKNYSTRTGMMLGYNLKIKNILPFFIQLNASRLYAIDESDFIHEIRNSVKQISLNPNASDFNWRDVLTTISRTKHHACSLTRDNYACHGSRYENILKNTVEFQQQCGLEHLAPGSRILLDGNSFLNELVLSWICESNHSKIAHLSRVNESNSSSNNMIIIIDPLINSNSNNNKFNKIEIVLIDNDIVLQTNITKLKEYLNYLEFSPNIISVSRNNFNISIIDKTKEYHSFFPNSRIFNYNNSKNNTNLDIGTSCGADFHNCIGFKRHHQCIPGLIIITIIFTILATIMILLL